MILIIVQICYAAICLAEAWLEQAVIYLKNPNLLDYNTWNTKEHARSLVYAGSVGVSLALIPALHGQIGTALILLPCLFFLRRIFFDFALKLIRGQRISVIAGDGWFDGLAKKIYGSRGGWLDVAASAAAVAIINWLA